MQPTHLLPYPLRLALWQNLHSQASVQYMSASAPLWSKQFPNGPLGRRFSSTRMWREANLLAEWMRLSQGRQKMASSASQ